MGLSLRLDSSKNEVLIDNSNLLEVPAALDDGDKLTQDSSTEPPTGASRHSSWDQNVDAKSSAPTSAQENVNNPEVFGGEVATRTTSGTAAPIELLITSSQTLSENQTNRHAVATQDFAPSKSKELPAAKDGERIAGLLTTFRRMLSLRLQASHKRSLYKESAALVKNYQQHVIFPLLKEFVEKTGDFADDDTKSAETLAQRLAEFEESLKDANDAWTNYNEHERSVIDLEWELINWEKEIYGRQEPLSPKRSETHSDNNGGNDDSQADSESIELGKLFGGSNLAPSDSQADMSAYDEVFDQTDDELEDSQHYGAHGKQPGAINNSAGVDQAMPSSFSISTSSLNGLNDSISDIVLNERDQFVFINVEDAAVNAREEHLLNNGAQHYTRADMHDLTNWLLQGRPLSEHLVLGQAKLLKGIGNIDLLRAWMSYVFESIASGAAGCVRTAETLKIKRNEDEPRHERTVRAWMWDPQSGFDHADSPFDITPAHDESLAPPSLAYCPESPAQLPTRTFADFPSTGNSAAPDRLHAQHDIGIQGELARNGTSDAPGRSRHDYPARQQHHYRTQSLPNLL